MTAIPPTDEGAPESSRLRRSSRSGPYGNMLSPEFYARSAVEVARDLLGRVVLSEIGGVRCAARIVEAEAYIGPHDDASHAAARIGRTARNEAMFGAPGTAYVYRIYGVHWCLNAVTDRPEYPAAVLIRAAEVVEGVEVAAQRRGGRPIRELLRGPGNLCRALAITGTQNHHDLTAAPLRILAGEPIPDSRVGCGRRVGITRAIDLPLRFWVLDDPHVSRHP